jgi:uncharacterized MAPEG superfamily protein
MPYVFTTSAKWMAIRQLKYFDNRDPRAYLAAAEGAAKRLHNAQLNSFEALPGFVAGVLTGTVVGADPELLDSLAVTWLVLRGLYGLCYLLDKPSLRSAVWFAALGVVLAMFGICL